MKSHEVEGRVEKAFNSIKPDILSSIISDAKDSSDTVISIDMPPKKKSRYSYYLRTAAILLICLMCFGGMGLYSRAYAVKTTVTLDMGSSAVLKLNGNEKVVEADELSGEESLKWLSLDEAVDAVLEKAIKDGSISENENSLLLSVESENVADSAILSRRLSAEIYGILKEKGLEASVMAQTIEENEGLRQLSSVLNISPGKAELINEIRGKNQSLSAEALAEMSINELNIVMDCTSSRPEDIETIGKASMGLYLDESSAKLAAETEIGLSDDELKNFSISLGYEDGSLIYDLNFDSGIYKYICTVDALSGKVQSHTEEFSEEFSSWLDQQDEEVKGWVQDNTDKIHDFTLSKSGDLEKLINECVTGVADLAEGVIDGVVSLVDLFLS